MYFSEWRKLQKDCDTSMVLQSFVAEGIKKEDFETIVHNFIPFAKKELKIKQLPKIHFISSSKFAKKIAAFGRIKDNRIVIDIENRHTMDILRTVAHELTHYSQHLRGIHGKGAVGSPTENEANKIAGIIVRKFAQAHSGLFTLPSVNEAKKKKRRNELIDRDYEHYPTELT